MKLMEFWSELSMANKYGLCAVAAAGVFVLLLYVL